MDEHSLEKRRAGQRQLAIRVVAMPADTNAAGDIFGGWLMSQMDVGGSIENLDRTARKFLDYVKQFEADKP